MTASGESESLSVVYDGDCPFCSAFVRLARLREAAGDVELIDARSAHPLVQRLRDEGYDLDEGMVAVLDGAIYHGADAAHVISALSSRNRRVNRLLFGLLRSRRTARLVYPGLRFARNLTLSVLGRRKLGTG